MNDIINDKLIEILDLLDNNSKVIRLKKLKTDIYNDKELSSLLEKYKSIENLYNNEVIKLKKQIIDNPKIKEYRELENELYYLVLEINKKLNILVDKKECNNESN